MIERYEVDEIKRIWSEENKFRRWLEVELAITETWAAMGQVPEQSLKNIRTKASFDAGRINEIEKKVKHDVIAFLTSVEEFVGEDSAYIHKGITSYDVVDTALSLLLCESLDAVIARCRSFASMLLLKARQYRETVAIGRTHGIHAEPIVFGVKYLIWFEEMKRNLARLQEARKRMAVGKISGSVGTYIHFPPEGEEKALARLGLEPCRVSSQIIQRDRHAEVMAALALLGTTLEKIAVEIRHLQKTEVLEAEEPFTAGQKGSSSMPHKRNPVRCERISGLARLLRAHLSVALENNILWHERDISHSSAERVFFPDSFHLAVFMLDDLADVVGNLHIYPEQMKRNLALTQGVYFSQKVLTRLVEKGMPRQRAYELVQKHALQAWLDKTPFRGLLEKDGEIVRFCPPGELEELFSERTMLANVDRIYDRFQNE